MIEQPAARPAPTSVPIRGTEVYCSVARAGWQPAFNRLLDSASIMDTPTSMLPIYVLLGLLILVIGLHAVFPRYEWRPVNPDGTAFIAYDRWDGRWQRVTYDDQGKLHLADVYIP
jgi:hypothetical protein